MCVTLIIRIGAISWIAAFASPQHSETAEDRIAEVVARGVPEWSSAQRAEITALVVKALDLATATGRREQALRALSSLLDQARPEVKPLFRSPYEKLNERVPFPEDLARREFEAAQNMLRVRLMAGVGKPCADADRVAAIRRQIDELWSASQKILLSRLTDETARAELRENVRLYKDLELRIVDDPFHLGLDRLLTPQEADALLRDVESEADRLKGVALAPRDLKDTSPEGLARWEAIQEQYAIVGDVATSVGRARLFCHAPEIFESLRTLEAVREEYTGWRHRAADEFNRVHGGRVPDAVNEVHRPQRPNEARTPTQGTLPKASGTETTHARAEPAQSSRHRRSLVIALALLGIGVLVLLWVRRRLP